jgi:hypothetical protein
MTVRDPIIGMGAATRSNLDSIAWLRRLVARLLESGDEAASWLASGAAIYEAGAGEGVTLCRALGLTPGPGQEGWWTTEARARRDDLLREMARRFYPDSRRPAADIASRLTRFAAGARLWRPGAIEELCHLLTKDGHVPSSRTVQRALAAGRHRQMLPPVTGTGPGVFPTHGATSDRADTIVDT